ncbi:class III lanthionine synthetase LanKC [Streptomyces sp. DSM 3412]|uniref:Class III lanthionine synthetase LanKC n=1 Tax=Streptomyces gottesmaniae TaxID=3075518 RepID=A0ABU2Z3Q3_9ACTN|nr:class III lanthionine synthetase LanKC [Streptomyces sp. DSM 3412]MDT0571210.1 class III lanthionine synthetase LanKC [Streptomyces sp. DSM 3412]
MDKRYEVYCLTDPHFYDAPSSHGGAHGRFRQARGPLPASWTRERVGDWLACRPDGVRLPPQGWKIHVSACLDNAQSILDDVWDHCVPRGVAFKFLPDLETLFLANAKYAHRGSSGKFVTVYPRDEAECERLLTELDRVLGGRPGPYILSDLRWRDGPLHVRYGAFADRYCVSADGVVEQAVADPSGRLVPDVRGPTFRVPEWVDLPGFLEPHLAASRSTTVADLPYRIDKALHFSNGGGLYAGVDRRTEERVVLKEARPYAGLTPDGADAVTRLEREREALERLRGLRCVPALRDHFELGGHRFLVEDFIEGKPLHQLIVERSPLAALDPDPAAFPEYTAWALDVLGRVRDAVTAVHERDIVIGDVHTFNVMVRPDDTVVLIDFEGASDVAHAHHQVLAAPGFHAPSTATGFDIDRYALACLEICLFLPLTGLIELDRGKAGRLAREAARLFPVPDGLFDEAVRTITGGEGTTVGTRTARTSVNDDEPRFEPDHAGWLRARESITSAILASATPDRDDRLFPGDIEQFAAPGGGLGMAHGAAGVLYALDVTGAGRHPDHEDWLIRHALHPPPGTRLGLYDGLHGVAFVLDHLGHREEAVKVLDMCLGERWENLALDLKGGLSGIGLALLHFADATGDAAHRAAAQRVAETVADRLGPADGVPETSGGAHPRAGLMYGSSGPALLFLRLHEHDGDPAHLDLAATALRQDLRRCVVREEGSMEVNEGFRTMPYLADGSVGIGMVLDDCLALRADEEFATAAHAIREASRASFYIEPGLFDGVAGMILHRARAHPPGTAAARDPVVAAHIRRLARHACLLDGRLAFPGEQLMRLSMDLATGGAGVALALGAACHGTPTGLPFLTPGRSAPDIPVPDHVREGR